MDPVSDQTLPSQPVNTQSLTQEVNSVIPKATNSLKKILFTILIFLVLVGVAGGSYYLGTKKSPAVIPIHQSEISPTAIQPTLTPDPTSNWQTYTNQQYGFSVKYPTTLNVIENTSKYVRFTTDKSGSNLPNSESYISILVEDNPNNLNLDSWVKANQNIQDFNKTLINGITAYKSNDSSRIYLENKGVIYQVSLVTMGGDSGLSNIFNQMLPTLQFTN